MLAFLVLAGAIVLIDRGGGPQAPSPADCAAAWNSPATAAVRAAAAARAGPARADGSTDGGPRCRLELTAGGTVAVAGELRGGRVLELAWGAPVTRTGAAVEDPNADADAAGVLTLR